MHNVSSFTGRLEKPKSHFTDQMTHFTCVYVVGSYRIFIQRKYFGELAITNKLYVCLCL